MRWNPSISNLVMIADSHHVRSYSIAEMLGLTDDEVWEYLIEIDRFFANEKKQRDADLRSIREESARIAEDIPEAERREMRRRYLLERIRDAKAKNEHPEKIRNLINQARIFTGELKGVTKEQIERARRFPLSSFFPHGTKQAKCHRHDEKTPSMDIRSGFYFCYGCGASGDVIDYVMETKHLSFAEAVLSLQ